LFWRHGILVLRADRSHRSKRACSGYRRGVSKAYTKDIAFAAAWPSLTSLIVGFQKIWTKLWVFGTCRIQVLHGKLVAFHADIIGVATQA